jgi:hypothetical protein
MKLSELKETIREISRNKFYESLNEASISIGSKEFINKNDSEDTILDIAKQYAKFPHSKLKTNQKQIVNAFADIAKLLGMPIKHPMDAITYVNGKPKKPSGKIKPEPGKSLLFPLLKTGKINKQEYVSLWNDLKAKYDGLIVSYLAFLYVQGGYVTVKGSSAAKSSAMKDMQGQFDI